MSVITTYLSGFTDGYTTTNATRVPFPLSGGFIALGAEHPKFACEYLYSQRSSLLRLIIM